jgi:hypothetical protein
MSNRFPHWQRALTIVIPLAVAVAAVLALSRDARRPSGDAAAPPPAPVEALRYDAEYPSIRYAQTEPTDRIAELRTSLASGAARLAFGAAGRGWLDPLLAALEIDPASQVLVFSRTSLQSRRIHPSTPRAIYFNDDVYVAWVRDGPIEIAATDPRLGVNYYLLEQTPAAPAFEREFSRCLSCHDSYSLSGGGVPRFIVGSGYTGANGELVSHEGWILVTDRTPFKSRWGGWSVTGRHGAEVHLGNVIIRDLADFQRLEELRVGNIEALDGLFDVRPYRATTSDIVALLVLEHQVNAQNEIVRFSWDARTALAADAGAAPSPATLERIEAAAEPLLETLLFVDAIDYTSPVSGSPQFVAQFAARAARDGQGRSLRDLDLVTRLFKYPLSYTIYSPSFDALPETAKALLYRRLAAILRGVDGGAAFAGIAAADRAAILDILTATKPDFASTLGN